MDLLIRILELPMGPALLIVSMIGVFYLASIKRVLSDFPPHRHAGKEILYPRGMSPEKPQELEEHTAARA